jgi:hypothetical protein
MLPILTSDFNVVDDPDRKKNLDTFNEYVFIWHVSKAKSMRRDASPARLVD